MISRALLRCLLVFCAVGSVQAQTFSVAVPPLTSLLEEDGSGVYQQLLDRALDPTDVELEQRFYPYRRALRVFEERDADCLLSLTDVLLSRFDKDELVYSFPLGKFVFHIFTPADEPPIDSVAALEGLSVGGIMGHEVYLQPLLGDIEVDQVRSEAQAVQMLELGRLDAVVAALPDIKPFLHRLNYAVESPLLESYDRLNCHATESNQAFVEALSDKLKQLKTEGAYREEAGPLYVPFSPDASEHPLPDR